jgi:hypothetical protein
MADWLVGWLKALEKFTLQFTYLVCVWCSSYKQVKGKERIPNEMNE